MGPEAAINAVYFNQIRRSRTRRARGLPHAERGEYSEDIDILHLARELVVDAVVEPEGLRKELIRRYAMAATKDRSFFATRRNPVTPA